MLDFLYCPIGYWIFEITLLTVPCVHEIDKSFLHKLLTLGVFSKNYEKFMYNPKNELLIWHYTYFFCYFLDKLSDLPKKYKNIGKK